MSAIPVCRHAAIAVAAASSLVSLAGCSSESPEDAAVKKSPAVTAGAPSTSAATSASPSADSRAQIEAVYRRYWDAKVQAYAKASIQGTDLKNYAVAEAYTQAETEVKALKAKGLVATGRPLLSPTVTAVDTRHMTPRGSLTDCTDVSDWTLVTKSTGRKVTLPAGRLTKYVTKVTAEQWYGTWVIVKVDPKEQAC
jgi:hypothetical protein